MRRRSANRRPVDYDIRVFINCPFDTRFKPIFDCIVFSVLVCGFHPRCTLQIDDASQTRIEKIFAILEECRFGIHDLSRTELDRVSRLPRFNMPLELGMFLGIKRSGSSSQRLKSCLVLDREKYRFQKFISDIAGQDIRAHNLEPARAISAVRDWLGTSSGTVLPGGAEIFRQYRRFMKEMPVFCRRGQVRQSELTFADFLNFATEWLKRELPVSALPVDGGSVSVTIYGIKNCDTMKKARAWLDSHGVGYDFHDYKAAGISKEKLKEWSDEVGWETLLNRAGTTFRKLPDADKEGLNGRKAIALMLAQPSMIKRPVLEAGGKLLVGFKPEIYAKEVRTGSR